MSRILVEGFETGDWSQWDTIWGDPMNITAVQKHGGSYSLNYSGLWAGFLSKNINVSNTIYGSLWFRWHYYAGGWGGGWNHPTPIIWFSGVTNLCQFGIAFEGLNGMLVVYTGSGPGSNSADVYITSRSTNYIFPYDTWNLLEFKLIVHPSQGVFQLKLNGGDTFLFDLHEIKTCSDISNMISTVRIGFDNRQNSFIYGWWDDLVLDDSDWPGSSKIISLPINNNGVTNQWTPTSGLNYQCIDEIVASDSDYIQTTTPDNLDLFTTSAFDPDLICNVKSIGELYRPWKEGGPSLLYTHPILFDGVHTDLHTDPLKLGYAVQPSMQIWENNPFTSSTLVATDINNFQFGVQAKKTNFNVVCHPVCLSMRLKLFYLPNTFLLYDSRCVAIWNFENGALTVDSKGNNTLTNFNSVTVDEVNYRQGRASASFSGSNSLSIANADMDVGFPFKGGGASEMTICCWLMQSGTQSGDQYPYTFGEGYNNKMSFCLDLFWSGRIYFMATTLGNNATYVINNISELPGGRWYHLVLRFGEVFETLGKYCAITVFDSTTGMNFLSYSISTSDAFISSDGHFSIGGWPGVGSFIGKIDQLIVFNKILTELEISSIRDGYWV